MTIESFSAQHEHLRNLSEMACVSLCGCLFALCAITEKATAAIEYVDFSNMNREIGKLVGESTDSGSLRSTMGLNNEPNLTIVVVYLAQIPNENNTTWYWCMYEGGKKISILTEIPLLSNCDLDFLKLADRKLLWKREEFSVILFLFVKTSTSLSSV